jgi:outer membrane protein assembly factor BamA
LTHHNTYNLQGDWRYFIFPTNTYGLGSRTKLSDAVPVDYSQVRIYETILGKVYENFSLGFGYIVNYFWNIKETKDSANQITTMDSYGGTRTSSISSGIVLSCQYDNRLNSNNPLNGNYANVQLRDNTALLGSNTNWHSLVVDLRHYFLVSEKREDVLAIWSYNWLTLSGKPPYFDLPYAAGDDYNNTCRGYVEGRFRGLNFLYAEAEYRFRILNNGFLGGIVFYNISSFSEYPSNKFDAVNPGYGLGLRMKMNKKSSVNLCADYGIGTDGSRGFVFNISEVF